LQAQLTVAVRRHIMRYYNMVLVCDDGACRTRTRVMGVHGKRCLVAGCRGQVWPEYSDSMLFTQLLYYSRLFDVDRAKEQ
ncbi:DNA polymerase alpha zinc finger-domain-containing protein, partial [Blyttiomyces helicus]